MTRILHLFVMIAFLSSCSANLVPFNEALYQRTNLTESELKRIQFWLSDDIVLQRVLEGNLTEIKGGEVKVVDGRKIEEIIIPKNTPGVLINMPARNRFAVAFEDGSDQRFLMFGPSPKANNDYVLLAKKWERDFGQVTYEGQRYQVAASSAFTSILVDLKKVNRTMRESRVASGRKVD